MRKIARTRANGRCLRHVMDLGSAVSRSCARRSKCCSSIRAKKHGVEKDRHTSAEQAALSMNSVIAIPRPDSSAAFTASMSAWPRATPPVPCLQVAEPLLARKGSPASALEAKLSNATRVGPSGAATAAPSAGKSQLCAGSGAGSAGPL